MKIAEVSKQYDISPDTLRYYERVGLMPHIARTAAGIRDYSESDCQRIQFIKCMRAATMPIEPLITYMRLFDEGDHTISERVELLKAQRTQIQKRIDEMQAGLDRLDCKIAYYERGGGARRDAHADASAVVYACSSGGAGAANSPDTEAGASPNPGAGAGAKKFSK